MTRRCTMILLGLCVLVGNAAAAEEPQPQLEFTIEANSGEYAAGTPVALRLTLRNVASEDYDIEFETGWGTGVTIQFAREGEEFKYLNQEPYVIHGDTEIGPVYMPHFCFVGRLAPGEEQHILHVIRAEDLGVGTIRLKASFHGRGLRLESGEVTVVIAESPADAGKETYSGEELSRLYSYVVRYHNGFDLEQRFAGEHTPLVATVEKALAGEGQTLDVEYALYAGVLQAMTNSPSAEDVILAERCFETLTKRLPDSWFRAHAQAALAAAHLSRAHVLAEGVAEQPGPLRDNLGIRGWLDAVRSTGLPCTRSYRPRMMLRRGRGVCPVCGSKL